MAVPPQVSTRNWKFPGKRCRVPGEREVIKAHNGAEVCRNEGQGIESTPVRELLLAGDRVAWGVGTQGFW